MFKPTALIAALQEIRLRARFDTVFDDVQEFEKYGFHLRFWSGLSRSAIGWIYDDIK